MSQENLSQGTLTQADDNVLLDVHHLDTFFKTESGRVKAVDDVSFQVKKGELLGIVGESGCGKSVTSLSIMGLVERPGMVEAEAINFEGQDLSKLNKEGFRKLRGKEMSMIFQEPLTSLNPLFTIGNQLYETVKLHNNMTPAQAKARCIEMLKLVGIPRPEQVYKSYPNTLSGGMRQRVMIAIALANNPKLLIADEPTTALDVTIQAQILQLMRNLMKEFHTAIMFITHDLGVIAEVADRVIVMYAGQIVEEADVFTLFSKPMHPYTQGLMKSTIKVHELEDSLSTIEGIVPSLSDMPEGCKFNPRCPLASAGCTEERPELVEVEPGHFVRCRRCAAEAAARKEAASHE